MSGKLTLTVSQLNEYVRRMFQMDPMLRSVELKGEISNLKFHQTGTVFFTLKDENASISCVMYGSDAQLLPGMPFDGMRAVVTGSVALYVKGGQMQFYAKTLRADGVGVLYERLLALKQKLSAEGLFDPERKRQIPYCPDTIGVVSSPTGAVIHDILNVSLRRNPNARILLCPVRVQGIGAAQEVAQAIGVLERLQSVSVIVVARGGGSMEDLFTFNEEEVVRAVAACTKPVVSAVGHETDVTLCDLAADLRAPTPSAAAECVTPVLADLQAAIASCRQALHQGVCAQLERKQTALGYMRGRLQASAPQIRLEQEEKRLAALKENLRTAVYRRLEGCSSAVLQRKKELDMLSPFRVLERGYAIVSLNGKAVTSGALLAPGDEIALRFAKGSASAVVKEGDGQEG